MPRATTKPVIGGKPKPMATTKPAFNKPGLTMVPAVMPRTGTGITGKDGRYVKKFYQTP